MAEAMKKPVRGPILPAPATGDPFGGLRTELECTLSDYGYLDRLGSTCEQVLGHSREELRAYPLAHFIHPDDLAESLRLTELQGSDLPVELENRWRRADGSLVWLRWRVARCADDLRIYVVVRDVTESKKPDHQSPAPTDEGGTRSSACRVLLADVSHELNTPMHGIIGMTELALETDLTVEQRDYIQTVQQCAQTLLDAVQRVLESMGAERRPLDRDLGRSEATTAPTSFRHLRVLLAEDNKVNQTLAVRMLERLGHTVELAENGREALDRWRASRFDVVLMDLQMPVMDGLEAVDLIREEEAARRSGGHIPIIAVTADGPAWTREELRERGLDELICKPVTPAALNAVVSQVVAGSLHSVNRKLRSTS
jgi:PAS domain S-box-containing protein